MTKSTLTYRTLFTLTIFFLFFFNFANGQIKKGEFINISIGFGISASYDEDDIIGTGFYAQGEYVYGLTTWFSARPYAGLLLTSADNNKITDNQPAYKVTTNAFLAGIKGRLIAPIPWVAPFFEIGVGASAGSFETFTPLTDIQKKGVVMHLPISIGLALGPKNNIEIEFTYYYHAYHFLFILFQLCQRSN
jgi:hypothetical protein